MNREQKFLAKKTDRFIQLTPAEAPIDKIVFVTSFTLSLIFLSRTPLLGQKSKLLTVNQEYELHVMQSPSRSLHTLSLSVVEKMAHEILQPDTED